MSGIITNVSYNEHGLTAVNSQDVEGIQKGCHERRDVSIAGTKGLGYLAAEIPVIEMLHASNQGIDLHDKEQRDKWLLKNPQYLCHVDTGNAGKIIIK